MSVWLHRILVVSAVSLVAWIAAASTTFGTETARGLAGVLGTLALHLALLGAVQGALRTSGAWRAPRLTLADGGWPTLRSLAWATPLGVAAQIVLGLAYRFQLTGIVPHVVWAFAAAIVVMMFGSFTLTLAGAPALMRRTSIWLLSLVSLQIMLGLSAFVLRVTGAAPGDLWFQAAAAGHAVTGALVLSLTALLSALVLRHVVPAADQPARHTMVSSGRPS